MSKNAVRSEAHVVLADQNDEQRLAARNQAATTVTLVTYTTKRGEPLEMYSWPSGIRLLPVDGEPGVLECDATGTRLRLVQ